MEDSTDKGPSVEDSTDTGLSMEDSTDKERGSLIQSSSSSLNEKERERNR